MYRFARAPLPREQVARLVTVIDGLHKPTLRAFFEHLRPDQHCLWELVNVPARYSDLQNEYVVCLLLLLGIDGTQAVVRRALGALQRLAYRGSSHS